MRAEYVAQWHAAHDAEFKHEANETAVVYRSNGDDDSLFHFANFFRAIKTRQHVLEDEVFGNHAALACHMANESYLRKTTVQFDHGSKSIKSVG